MRMAIFVRTTPALRIDAACGSKRRTARGQCARSADTGTTLYATSVTSGRRWIEKCSDNCHQTVHEDCMRDAPEHEFLIELGNYNRHRTAGYWGSFKAHVSYRGCPAESILGA